MFKKLKLAPKLSIILGGILTGIFILLIVVTSVLIGTSIRASVKGELQSLSQLNAERIQTIFSSVEDVADNMDGYLEESKLLAKTDPTRADLSSSLGMAHLFESSVYAKTLSPLNYDIEVYLRETARSAVRNNPNIAGFGVMYEPYQFQSNLYDYAFYVNGTDDVGAVGSFGSYSEYSTTPYYQEAATTLSDVITEPYEGNGAQIMTMAVPLQYNGKFTGVVMADIDYSSFSGLQVTNERFPSLLVTIYDSNETAVYTTGSSDSHSWGQKLGDFIPSTQEMEGIRALLAVGEPFQFETTQVNGSKLTRFFTPLSVGGQTWWSLTAVGSADMNKDITQTVLLMTVLSVAFLVVLLLVTVLVLQRMLRPLGAVVQAAEGIAEGRLDVQLAVNSQDEVGILSATFQRMVDNLRRMVTDVQYLLGEMAEGNFNLTTQAEDSYVGEFEQFLLSIRKLNRTLNITLEQILISSDQVAAGSDQVASGAQALSQGASEQASSIEELAATINDISTQLGRTAENARLASDKTSAVGQSSNDSTEKMAQMLEAMTDIRARSSEIEKIVKTIEDIAFQTNILALNAAVEAARAGAAGKGFAVVADEVRNLSRKSAEASKSTSELIHSSLIAVERGTRIADETARSLAEAVLGVQEATEIIDLISSATSEQAASISQVTVGVDQISSVVQTTAATAEESAATSEELSGHSQILRELVGQFTLRTDSEE